MRSKREIKNLFKKKSIIMNDNRYIIKRLEKNNLLMMNYI